MKGHEFSVMLKGENQVCKIVIDRVSCLNVVFKFVIPNVGLKLEPHPQPLSVA